jgi:S-(hydroxymethyl)glutathione dehydrogenase/alcohol dehydrogenase
VVRAALFRQVGAPLEPVDLDLAPTGPDQVRVRLAASGVCHSDLSVIDGSFPYPAPAVLGHEGAGVVTEVGADVTTVAPGDHVIVAWNQPCRECFFCRRGEAHLCDRAMADALGHPYGEADGTAVVSMQGAGTFTEETLVLERAVVRVDPSLPLELAALIGCAVTTGAGAALNTADIEPGDTVVVIGCGGVGLSTVQGARIAGAGRIVAVDLVADKLEIARALGATHTVDAGDTDPVAAVRELTEQRGADVAFEVLGRAETLKQAYACTRRGGQTIIVGAGPMGRTVEFDLLELFFSARKLVGCVYGSSDPARDFPRLANLATDGDLDLERLVTHRIGLDDVNDALDRIRRGEGIRSVIVYDR